MSTLNIICKECGADLETEVFPYGELKVTPCGACVEQAKEEGKDEGYEAGNVKGYDQGYQEGHDDGYAEGEQYAQDEAGL